MTKEKLKSLQTYKAKLEQRLNEEIPPKHRHRVKQFKEFLTNEIKAVKAKIDAALLEQQGGGR